MKTLDRLIDTFIVLLAWLVAFPIGLARYIAAVVLLLGIEVFSVWTE